MRVCWTDTTTEKAGAELSLFRQGQNLDTNYLCQIFCYTYWPHVNSSASSTAAERQCAIIKDHLKTFNSRVSSGNLHFVIRPTQDISISYFFPLRPLRVESQFV